MGEREEKGDDLRGDKGLSLNRERADNILGRKREKFQKEKGPWGGQGEWISTGKGGQKSLRGRGARGQFQRNAKKIAGL